MMSSDTPPIKLYGALLAAQQDFSAVVKNKQNPHLKNFYADLGAVLDAVTAPLANHGLLIVQRFSHDQGGPILITELVHTASGERIGSELPVISKDPTDPQKLGGAITYMRRYSLMALLSLNAEDDDGNAASSPQPPRAPQGNRPTPAPQAQQRQPQDQSVPFNKFPPQPPYAPVKAVAQELALRAAEPLDEKDFDAAISAAWMAFHAGKIYETAVMGLNAVRGRFNEEQRAIALDEVSKLREAYAERDAALAQPAPAAMAPVHAGATG